MMYMQVGEMPLHLAKSAEVAKVLLDNGADINVKEKVCVHTSCRVVWGFCGRGKVGAVLVG